MCDATTEGDNPEDMVGYGYAATKAAVVSLKKLNFNVLAMGDSYNDIAMLKHVGLGVAMGNAKPELKQVADLVTESNVNDGVATQLETLFNLK